MNRNILIWNAISNLPDSNFSPGPNFCNQKSLCKIEKRPMPFIIDALNYQLPRYVALACTYLVVEMSQTNFRVPKPINFLDTLPWLAPT